MAIAERITLNLNEEIEFERELAEAYRQKPRSRRQEWIRSLLRAGLRVVNEAETSTATSAASRDGSPRRSEPFEGAAKRLPASGPQPSNAGPTAAQAPAADPAVEPPAREAGQIKGFFGD